MTNTKLRLVSPATEKRTVAPIRRPNSELRPREHLTEREVEKLIEAAKGSGIVQKIIGWMQHRQLADIILEPEIQALYAPLYQRHVDSIDLIQGRARQDDGVVFFDLAGQDVEGYNKFIPYYLFPSSTYTVSVSPSSFRTKISVGSNPWTPVEPKHNLASICERYGGGGHPKVGAISFEIGAIEEARKAAAEITAELSE